MRLVILGLVLLVLLAAAARSVSLRPSPPRINAKPNQGEPRAEIPLPALHPTAPDPVILIAELMARIPATYDTFDFKNWLELEAALISHPESLTPLLLDRYSSEGEPIYKGLFAVLLATNPATHRRILDAFVGNGVDFWDLFRGMAILALVKVPSVSVEAARSDVNLEYWKNLLRFLMSEQSDLKYERWAKAHPDEPGRPWRCGGGSWYRMRSEIESRVGAVSSPEIRDLLLNCFEEKWEWLWIREISQKALNRTMVEDSNFAENIFQRYFATEERAQAVLGFDLIGSAKISEDRIPAIEMWARRAVHDDPKVFADSVDLLGDQSGPESERILVDLYWLSEGREKARALVVDAMQSNGGPSFKPIAEKELASPDPITRIEAIRLLARCDPGGYAPLVIDVVQGDASPRVRYCALAVLKECWTSKVEEAVKRAAESDPEERVRHLANVLLQAEDRQHVRTLSDWDWYDPGEE